MIYRNILVIDDEEINREIISSCFEDDYSVLTAESGEEALDIISKHDDIAAILLDIYMPGMSGLDVLEELNKLGLIKKIPVFIITAANDTQILSRAYSLGAEDIISKPFNINFMRCRVENIIELYRRRDDLQSVVDEQVKKLNAVSISMIAGLASVIEFRDGESGEHVKRMSTLTGEILETIGELYPEYKLPGITIQHIITASILHDVGKIAIPDSILKKPGRLTKEEFEVMKEHTVRGEQLLLQIPDIIDDSISEYCRDICRHHHERWDGGGYPDKLKGDEITLWAQAASIADVYDALTSPRCYKPAFTKEKALQMIINGECGQFNPKIIDALMKIKNSEAV